MGNIFMSERIKIFNFHWAVIALHTLNGVILVVTGKEQIDPQFFVSVAWLVFIGCIFSIWVAIMLIIAYWSGDFEAIFDEQFLNIDGTANRRVRRLDEDFMEDFENINMLIYKKYISLNDNSCPICLCDYQEGDVLKILPGWYHTFHKECIKHWFKNQLKCPFCREDITHEQIEKDKDMTEEELIKKIKCSESFAGSQYGRNYEKVDEVEVRMKDLHGSVDLESEKEESNNIFKHKNSFPWITNARPKLTNYKKLKGRNEIFGGSQVVSSKVLNKTQKVDINYETSKALLIAPFNENSKEDDTKLKVDIENQKRAEGLMTGKKAALFPKKSVDLTAKKDIVKYFEMMDEDEDHV